MRRWAIAGLVALSAGAPAATAALPGSEPASADFARRLDEYVDVHKAAEHAVSSLDKRTDAAAIATHEKALAEGIRRLRARARPGDVFGKEGRTLVADAIRAELAGPGGAAELSQVREQNPETETPGEPVTLAVNADYTSGASLSSVPAGLLGRLPSLPRQLDYRFVGRHLVLRDTGAHIIVDYIENALP